jgi:hypothetical protein
MDQLGDVFRQYLKQIRSEQVRRAQAMSLELRRAGTSRPQIEELLYASGYEPSIVEEVLEQIPSKKHP